MTRSAGSTGYGSVMPVPFDEPLIRLLDGKNFATVATVNADGSPHSSVVWLQRDGDAIRFSATSRRQKVINLLRDPRVSVSMFDLANPYSSVEIRGRAEILADPARTLSKELSHKYLGQDPPPEPPEVERVIVRIVPERIVRFSA
jgi:PPOX class probable F420-dependent enzyme